MDNIPERMKEQVLHLHFELLLKHVQKIVNKALIRRDSDEEIVVAGLFAKITDNANAIQLLLKNRYSPEAEIVARSALEALLYMGACLRSKQAVKSYMGKYAKQSMKDINLVLHNSDYFKIDKATISEFQKKTVELKKQISNRDIRYLGVERAARIAKAYALYLRYRVVSDADHSDPMYLKETYMDYDSKGITQILLGPNPSRTKEVLLTINTVLFNASKWYREKFAIPSEPRIDKMEQQYEIRK